MQDIDTEQLESLISQERFKPEALQELGVDIDVFEKLYKQVYGQDADIHMYKAGQNEVFMTAFPEIARRDLVESDGEEEGEATGSGGGSGGGGYKVASMEIIELAAEVRRREIAQFFKDVKAGEYETLPDLDDLNPRLREHAVGLYIEANPEYLEIALMNDEERAEESAELNLKLSMLTNGDYDKYMGFANNPTKNPDSSTLNAIKNVRTRIKTEPEFKLLMKKQYLMDRFKSPNSPVFRFLRDVQYGSPEKLEELKISYKTLSELGLITMPTEEAELLDAKMNRGGKRDKAIGFANQLNDGGTTFNAGEGEPAPIEGAPMQAPAVENASPEDVAAPSTQVPLTDGAQQVPQQEGVSAPVQPADQTQPEQTQPPATQEPMEVLATAPKSIQDAIQKQQQPAAEATVQMQSPEVQDPSAEAASMQPVDTVKPEEVSVAPVSQKPATPISSTPDPKAPSVPGVADALKAAEFPKAEAEQPEAASDQEGPDAENSRDTSKAPKRT